MIELRNVIHFDAQNSAVDRNCGSIPERPVISEDNEADAVLLGRQRLRKVDYGLAIVRH